MPTFIRVKDPSNGHEFDLPEGHYWLTSGEVVQVKSDRYPPSPVARPEKFHIGPVMTGTAKAAEPAVPEKE